jgi:DNA-binding CsgD family transcriptional regulator
MAKHKNVAMETIGQVSDKIYLKIKAAWNTFFGDAINFKYDVEIIEKYPFLNYFKDNSIVYTFFDHKNYKMIYVSEGFYELYGVNKFDYNLYGDKIVITNFDNSQMDFHLIFPKYMQQFWQNLSKSNQKDIKATSVGLKYNHPLKGEVRFLTQSYIIETDENNLPAISLILHHDISYLIKSDFHWFRIYCDKEPNKTLVYHSESKELLKGDIFSKREKEILKLIVKGKTTDEIAAILYISKITVNNHRQNMFNRLGVKGSTALITIAKMCNLLE